MKYYKPNSEPLKLLEEGKIKSDEIVYTELGKCVQKVYVGNPATAYYVEVAESVLNEGEIISALTPLQLELFWKLSRNKLKKYEDSN